MVINEIQEKLLARSNTRQFLDKHYEDAFYEVAKLVSKNKGSLEEAKDIFHDAIIILLQRKANEKQIDWELSYLIGISRHLLLARIQSEKKMKTLDEFSLNSFGSEENVVVKSSTLLKFIIRTGKKCLDLLTSVYMEKQSMKGIADKFGFTSEHSASVQKYKCIEKVRDTIKSKHLSYEDFFE